MNASLDEGHPEELTASYFAIDAQVAAAPLDDRAGPSQRLRHDSNVRPSV